MASIDDVASLMDLAAAFVEFVAFNAVSVGLPNLDRYVIPRVGD